MRDLPGILGFAAIHFLVSFFLAFSAGVGPGPNSPVGIAATILTFPLSVLNPPDTVPGFVFWLAWALLSFGWGALLLFVARRLFGVRR